MALSNADHNHIDMGTPPYQIGDEFERRDEDYTTRTYVVTGVAWNQRSDDWSITAKDMTVKDWGKPNLVWVIKRVHEAGYIRKDSKVYFTTIRDVLGQAGLTVDTTQIRSALEMVGCPVGKGTVHEADLADLFDRMDNENANDLAEINKAC